MTCIQKDGGDDDGGGRGQKVGGGNDGRGQEVGGGSACTYEGDGTPRGTQVNGPVCLGL